jgi:hypothetical protein
MINLENTGILCHGHTAHARGIPFNENMLNWVALFCCVSAVGYAVRLYFSRNICDILLIALGQDRPEGPCY